MKILQSRYRWPYMLAIATIISWCISALIGFYAFDASFTCGFSGGCSPANERLNLIATILSLITWALAIVTAYWTALTSRYRIIWLTCLTILLLILFTWSLQKLPLNEPLINIFGTFYRFPIS